MTCHLTGFRHLILYPDARVLERKMRMVTNGSHVKLASDYPVTSRSKKPLERRLTIPCAIMAPICRTGLGAKKQSGKEASGLLQFQRALVRSLGPTGRYACNRKAVQSRRSALGFACGPTASLWIDLWRNAIGITRISMVLMSAPALLLAEFQAVITFLCNNLQWLAQLHYLPVHSICRIVCQSSALALPSDLPLLVYDLFPRVDAQR